MRISLVEKAHVEPYPNKLLCSWAHVDVLFWNVQGKAFVVIIVVACAGAVYIGTVFRAVVAMVPSVKFNFADTVF